MSEIERNNALRKYVDLKKEAVELDRKAKDAKAARDEQMRVCHEILTKGGTKGSTTVDLGPGYGTVRFTPRKTKYADIHDERKFLEWIEENGRGDELFFPDKLRMKPVNEMVREIVDHEDAEFPPGLGFREQLGVTVTKV